MLLQETGIPDNVAYLALGMGVLAVFVGGWVASVVLRLRNLRRELALLEEMDAEEAA